MVGSVNGLAGMKAAWEVLAGGGAPLDAALSVVGGVEADPTDTSVGLGGLPNEHGVVQLDAACMDGATHNSGAVAALENILHPSQVARLVMERTDHCLLVGQGAYEFARMHGHPHQDLLTENARRIWLRWKETMSDTDDRFAPPPTSDAEVKTGFVPDFSDDPDGALVALDPTRDEYPWHGTIHCSALARDGNVACTTTTSGLAFKVPGRVGDSPIVGAGLYCDAEAGSAGATGRGEAAILANGSFAIVELLRNGVSPEEAGLEVLRRVTRQVRRQAKWQPALIDEDGRPTFGLKFYVLDLAGRWAGVSLRGSGGSFAVADRDGVREEPLTVLHPE
jgi:N4-(beta-N-acetylglucosaminyl)-L-asparaginase